MCGNGTTSRGKGRFGLGIGENASVLCATRRRKCQSGGERRGLGSGQEVALSDLRRGVRD